jgi:hypothetical protein
MNCTDIARKIEQRYPHSSTMETARLCMLICNAVDSLQQLKDDAYFLQVCDEMSLRLQAANDQHEAMTRELEQLATSDPRQFNPDQIWVLVRAIKVQSQILRLYVGDELLELS